MTLPKLSRHSLELKLLILFILVAGIPLISSNLLWFNSSRDQILKVTSARLESTTSDQAHHVENYLSLKETSLIIHSQTDSILNFDVQKAPTELHSLMLQDTDVEEATLIDKSGMEVIRMNRDRVFSQNELINESSSAAFKVPTFVGGDEYISPITLDQSGHPTVYIAVPIVKPENGQILSNLTTSAIGQYRASGEILGVLKVTYNIENLWQELATAQISQHGYVFLVDDKGNVLFHPNSSYENNQINLSGVPEVSNFLQSLKDPNQENIMVSQTKNELGQLSLTAHSIVKPTNWGLITEIPLSDTFADTNQVTIFAIVIFLVFINLVILISLWISGKIVHPIRLLQEGTALIGRGQLDHRLDVHTGDEIENLAQGFNSMAENMKRSIYQISAERNKLEVILSGITDGVLAVDLNRNIITFNKVMENMTGFTSNQVLGKPVSRIVRLFDQKEELKQEVYCPIRSDGFEGIAFSKKGLMLVGINNKSTPVNLIVGQIKEGLRVNLGAILTFHDISGEKQLEEMKLDFVSMAAHELRTPLTSIKGYLYILIRDYKKSFDEKQTTIITRVNIATQRLVGLVENLLNVTRIERGALTVHLEPMDWVVNVKAVIGEIVDQAKDKKIELSFEETPTPIPLVYVDKFRINEVLTNLLSNAINYTQPGGRVKIWLELTPTELITHIQDSGEGIPSSALPHLFTKFFRVSGKLEQGSKGTGLGLYIAKSIIAMHNGRIWAESAGVGKGSTFSFALPTKENNQTITNYGQQ